MKRTLLTLRLKSDRIFTRSGFLLLAASLLAAVSIAVTTLSMNGSAAPPPVAGTFSDELKSAQQVRRTVEVAPASAKAAPAMTTVLHFQGNTEDPPQGDGLQNCTGDGRTDLVACDGPFLSENATLSSSPTARWVIQSAQGGANNRTIYDTSWVWRPSAPTTVGGDMTIEFWAEVNALGTPPAGTMEWRVKLSNVIGGPTTNSTPPVLSAGEFYHAFHTATPTLPLVPQKLTINLTNVPVTDVTGGMVLVIEPRFSDSGANSRIWYDSTTPCPGAVGMAACDSTITLDVTTTVPPPSPTPTPTPDPSAELIFSIDATASDGTVNANETYIDVIKVKNGTSSVASNVTVQAVLAPGAVFLSGPTTPAATGAGTSVDPLVWNLPNLAAGATANIYLYLRAKSTTEDNTIVWQLLDTQSTLSYTLNGTGRLTTDTTMGPKVVPTGDVGDTVRHGKRPFPVAYVEYVDMKHTRPDSIFLGFFDSLITRYLEMSMNQLLPQPTMPSLGVAARTFASTPSERYRFSTVQPAGFCGGATQAEDGDPYDDDTPPPTMTNRIENGWYQLPGTRGYYGSDSFGSAYPGALTGVGLVFTVDNGCGPPGKIAYDAATLMDPDVDYNDFDTDRDGWVDFFELVYQGQPENILGQTGADNVWPHSSGLQYYYTDGYTSHDRLRDHQDRLLFWTDDTHTATTLTDTGKPAFVRVGAYNVNAEFSDEVTFAHEYGHSLGLPDEYSLGTRNTIDDWSLMSSGSGHMGIWDKQELGWIVPTLINSPRNVTGQKELKFDTHQIEWRDSTGNPYTLTGNVHNAEVYKVDLPKIQLFDPSLIPSGSWVYYSQAGNGFGYPGHLLDIAFDGNTTAGSTSLKLQFKSWFEIEKDYDYAYLQVCQFRGTPATFQCDNLESINDQAEGGPTTGVPDTNPNGTNHGNGMTCSSGASDDPTCGVAAYPEPEFITDEFNLTPYIGQDFLVRWAYSTDPGLAFRGWVIDDIELLKNGTTRVFFDDAEDPILSNDDTHAYNGWIRSNGTATQEHAYWIGVRDKTGFDSTAAWTAGVTLEYANEAHGYGNFGVDDPPAYTVVDSHPTAGSNTPNLNDAAWNPFVSDPGNLTANNGDVFTDCDDQAYADGPRHVDNYADPNSADGNWHFGWGKLKFLVNSTTGLGTFGTMTASVNYTLPAPCTNSPPAPGTLQFSAATYNVAEAGGSVTITVTRANGSDGAVSVDYVTSNGTATAGLDYTGASGTLNFANGETSKTFSVAVTDDALDESDETVNLTLSNPTGGATLGTPKAAVLTIADNDPQPSLSINDVSANEGNSGTTNFTFTVTLSAASGQSVTVNCVTAPGTATAGSDYVHISNTLTFSPGETSKTVTVLVNGDTANEPNEAFGVNLMNAQNATISDSDGTGTILNDDAPTIQFGASTYTVGEGGSKVDTTITRLGDPSGAATVSLATSDSAGTQNCNVVNGAASERCDYETRMTTVRFASGETSKTVSVFIIDDSYLEGSESFVVSLSNPSGASLGTPATATVTITDNDSADGPNPIDVTAFFVRLHYLDFLNREPDGPGGAFWINNIDKCSDPSQRPPDRPTLAGCIDRQRETTSGAFFLSDEFQLTGYFVYLYYTGSLNRVPTYREFERDAQTVANGVVVNNQWSPTVLNQNRAAFAEEFITRPEFKAIYDGLDNQQYVDKLFQTTGIQVTDNDRTSLAASLNNSTDTRATALHKVVEGIAINSDNSRHFTTPYGHDHYLKRFNAGFVQMEYFGYLRRDPDASGYQHWKGKLDFYSTQRTGNYGTYLTAQQGEYIQAEMVRAFIVSDEYRRRFGPQPTTANATETMGVMQKLFQKLSVVLALG